MDGQAQGRSRDVREDMNSEIEVWQDQWRGGKTDFGRKKE